MSHSLMARGTIQKSHNDYDIIYLVINLHLCHKCKHYYDIDSHKISVH